MPKISGSGMTTPSATSWNGGFVFGEFGDRHDDLFVAHEFAQARNENFAHQDDRRRDQVPMPKAAVKAEDDQQRADQKLVGDRIEHAADWRKPCRICGPDSRRNSR